MARATGPGASRMLASTPPVSLVKPPPERGPRPHTHTAESRVGFASDPGEPPAVRAPKRPRVTSSRRAPWTSPRGWACAGNADLTTPERQPLQPPTPRGASRPTPRRAARPVGANTVESRSSPTSEEAAPFHAGTPWWMPPRAAAHRSARPDARRSGHPRLRSRSRRPPRRTWTRRPGCACAPRSRPESPLPGSVPARRPAPTTDESVVRACPRDAAVRPCWTRCRAVTLLAPRQAAPCQSPPSPETRLATPPECGRPAFRRRGTPVVSDAWIDPPKRAPPRGRLSSPRARSRGNPHQHEAGENDPRRGRRVGPGILRVVRASEEVRSGTTEAAPAHPQTPQPRLTGRPPEPRSERPRGRRRAALLGFGLGNPPPGPAPPGPSWGEPGSSPPPRRSPGWSTPA